MKLHDFGEIFTTRIKEFCNQHDLESDCRVDSAVSITTKRGPDQLSVSEVKAFACFAKGLSLEETAKTLERALSTTSGYLLTYIRHIEISDPTPWVTAVNIHKIEAAVEELGRGPLKTIFIKLEEKISYIEIRIVIECLKVRDRKEKVQKKECSSLSS